MNENIDLSKILNGCPKGTILYSSLFGEVKLVEVYSDSIEVSYNGKESEFFNQEGKYYRHFANAECLLFPSKDQRDWNKFERFWDKPKIKKFDPKTFQTFDKVLVRIWANYDCCEWYIDLFEYFDEKTKMAFTLSSLPNNWVIPYNDETKHLVNATDDCPEYYKWWED